MTTLYTDDYAEAVSAVADAGAAVTFTVTTPGTYDGTTDTYSTPVTTTVAGVAIQAKADVIAYQKLELVVGEAPTLFFVPNTIGNMPVLGMTVTWGGLPYTVRSVAPVDPDGTAIAARVIVAR